MGPAVFLWEKLGLTDVIAQAMQVVLDKEYVLCLSVSDNEILRCLEFRMFNSKS